LNVACCSPRSGVHFPSSYRVIPHTAFCLSQSEDFLL
jgi:hypothetical protein